MNFNEFKNLLSSIAEPVVLLEGSRDLEVEHRDMLVEFAAKLASVFPTAIFRSGDALGSDSAFAEGINQINTALLQLVLPNDRKAKTQNQETRVSLEQLPPREKSKLIELTKRATPANKPLIEFYEKGLEGRARYQAQYLIRDTLKVIGSKKFKLRSATIGCFYVNSTKATGGGTGHTIRVCEQATVPIVTQGDWFQWLRAI